MIRPSIDVFGPGPRRSSDQCQIFLGQGGIAVLEILILDHREAAWFAAVSPLDLGIGSIRGGTIPIE